MVCEEEEFSIKRVIKASLEDFSEENKEAYDILISHVDDNFFQTRNTHKFLKFMANQLLDTISEDASDEN